MYKWKKDGSYDHIRATTQKSIRIDKETEEIINAINGRSFSDKVRNMAQEYINMKERITNS